MPRAPADTITFRPRPCPYLGLITLQLAWVVRRRGDSIPTRDSWHYRTGYDGSSPDRHLASPLLGATRWTAAAVYRSVTTGHAYMSMNMCQSGLNELNKVTEHPTTHSPPYYAKMITNRHYASCTVMNVIYPTLQSHPTLSSQSHHGVPKCFRRSLILACTLRPA